MLKDAPIGSPLFYLYNVLYLTFFTGIMTFGMLFVFYITYEAPNPLKDVEKMLGENANEYNVIQDNIHKDVLVNLDENDRELLEKYFVSSEILRFYVTDKETDEKIMTVVSVSSGGFGGPVKALVGINNEGEVKGLYVLDSSTETAGLGQKISESAFQRQFIGKKKEELPIDRTEWAPKQLDMISGATFSSSSVVSNILKAFDLYKIGGGN